ncbi:MAG TPA: imidazole glycerol phosphate synthase subunit HisH [Balneola sp.]|jgi:imidazole glycerol-phosphate synthase subunit HisH|nr:imidazole glycerol phosphate synthase subunit HisH [Balneola sp.]MAO77153.1 imidazole glycerol phosphate synthase subunit HisH [Balneola sp.]MBF63398.1 imidazole glycerol phosphate synthase subunit HisH [Balneola sp.]HAW79453.1 imidazole glycerol phosphate synthase subunit HisH [Balneola sp.]HBZ37273.1 imidazole glycerol phosphate synthase subunit HisH [Balneola sp.]|tara:strand:+ start:8642 stop:9247 length:606 start_codon:yes stop_codon:yes gene_type:complete
MVTIIDYGMGNIGSVLNMFKRIGVESKITKDLNEISESEKILLPGVGAFDNAMKRINESGLREVLDKKALEDKIPILGICLGMQLLTRGSEEGTIPGLGWIPADTLKFPKEKKLKVPHMGWNLVYPETESKLTNGLPDESRYYFVHSYHVKVDSVENSILKTNYGVMFDSAIQKDNIYGTQFHPEKSHKFGMELLRNFSKI